MTAPSYVVFSRQYGFLCGEGFTREVERAAVFKFRQASEAARAAAKMYGVCVSLKKTVWLTWAETRDGQNAYVKAHAAEINASINKWIEEGLLKLNEPNGRTLGY